jgi:hypothetical protein
VLNNGTVNATGTNQVVGDLNGTSSVNGAGGTAYGGTTIVGTGTTASLTANSIHQGSLTINANATLGTTLAAGDNDFTMAVPNARTVVLSSLAINGTFSQITFTGTQGVLDLKNSDLILYAPGTAGTTYTNIEQLVLNGINSGGTNGIISTDTRTFGPGFLAGFAVFDNNNAGLSSWNNITVNAGVNFDQVIAKYTYYGDLDLNGVVNFDDYNALLSNFNTSTTVGWLAGDLTGDGLVDTNDQSLLLSQFGAGTGGPNGNPLPEPSSFVLGFLGLLGLLLARRKLGKK